MACGHSRQNLPGSRSGWLSGTGQVRASHLRKFARPRHHDIVTFVLWCAAGVLTVIGAALYIRLVAILSAANPAVRLPWIGRPANTPRGAKVLGFFAVLPTIPAGECVLYALDWLQHSYYILWAL